MLLFTDPWIIRHLRVKYYICTINNMPDLMMMMMGTDLFVSFVVYLLLLLDCTRR